VELQYGEAAPSYVAGTSNFYAVTRYNWSSYYAMAVIEMGNAVRRVSRGEAVTSVASNRPRRNRGVRPRFSGQHSRPLKRPAGWASGVG